MMTLLWRREVGSRASVRDLGLTPDDLTATWIDFDQWMWIERAGQRRGVYTLQIVRDNDADAYTMVLAVIADLGLPGLPSIDIEVDVEVIMNGRMEMQTLQGRLAAFDLPMTLDAFVESSELIYRFVGPPAAIQGGEQTARRPLDRPLMMAGAIRPIVLTQSHRLRVGRSWTTRASDPLRGSLDAVVHVEVVARESIEIDGETVEAFRVVESAGDMRTTSWHDGEGVLLRTDMGNGLVLTRALAEEARERHPALKTPRVFPPIDREAMRVSAVASDADAAPGLLPWFGPPG